MVIRFLLSVWMLRIANAGNSSSLLSLNSSEVFINSVMFSSHCTRTCQRGAKLPTDPSVQTYKLVRYQTLIQFGAVVYTKTGVEGYSSVSVNRNTSGGLVPAVYVGAKNWLIQFDLEFKETDSVELPPPPEDVYKCRKNFSIDECYNAIKYVVIEDLLLIDVCGTYAYAPACSIRRSSRISNKEVGKIPGYAPKDPKEPVASLGTGKTHFLGFVNPDTDRPEILSADLRSRSLVIRTLDEKGWLNGPEFVGAFTPSEADKFVYIVFRETALESSAGVVSRVARICKNDAGVPFNETRLEKKFGSFIKAQLLCNSVDFKIQSISYIENDVFFWATFYSTTNGSAICAFSIGDLDEAFHGPFLHFDSEQGIWEECPPPYVYPEEVNAATCFGFRSKAAVVNFTLMSTLISASCSELIPDVNLNKVAVDIVTCDCVPKYHAHEVYAGDDQGRIWKVAFVEGSCASGKIGNRSAENWEVATNQTSKDITGLAILGNFVIVLTGKSVLKIPNNVDFPGEIIGPTVMTASLSTTTYTRTASTDWTGSPRVPTDPSNFSHSLFDNSYSFITFLLIATERMRAHPRN